jgi:hypothetical protein
MRKKSSQHKRALLIGVNKYPKLPKELQLHGCANDVALVHSVLRSLGFRAGNIKVLLNREATRKAILNALKQLVEDCRTDDIVVIHYSGHGSNMPSVSPDKASGYDESIVPSDSGRKGHNYPVQAKNRDITNTEIHHWLSLLAKKTSHITLIFDSCHSGSIARIRDIFEAGTRLRWVPPDPLAGDDQTIAVSARNISETSTSGWLPLSDRYALLAACSAQQGAFELDYDGGNSIKRYGAFTFYLTKEIQAATSLRTYRDIWEIVSLKIANQFQGKQTPQLEGARDRLLFDVDNIVPGNYLLISERKGTQVKLQGGAIHGLTRGSQWEVYPAAAKQAKLYQRQGTVQITNVGINEASAKIVAEAKPNAIKAGARGVEVLHADAETRMSISFAPIPNGYDKQLAQLKQELAKSELLRIKKNAATGLKIILLLPGKPGWEIVETIKQKFRREPLWAVIGQSDKTLWMGPSPLSLKDGIRKLRDNLETIWRYKKISELSNEKSRLLGKVQFILLKQDRKDNWRPVNSIDRVTYQAGERIAFRVINKSSVPIYASVLDLGLSKRIDVLYPADRGSELIGVSPKGRVLTVGADDESAINLYFPKELTFLSDRDGGGQLMGREVFKLIVTTKPHDLGFLRAGGLRKQRPLGDLKHPLEKLAYLASKGGSKREAEQRLAPDQEWLTIERSFWLKESD